MAFSRMLMGCFTGDHESFPRVQDTRRSVPHNKPSMQESRRSWLGCLQRDTSGNYTDSKKRCKTYMIVVDDGQLCPFAFTRSYWFQRRHALTSRLFQLYNETGDPKIIGAAAEMWKCMKQVMSEPICQDPQQSQGLADRVLALWDRLAERALNGDVPGRGALLEQIDQCVTILGQKASWFDPNDYQRPDHEVDLSAIAAFAAQGEQPDWAPTDEGAKICYPMKELAPMISHIREKTLSGPAQYYIGRC